MTYRWVDADGVHYSDQPQPGAEIVELGKPQTYTAAATPTTATATATAPARRARSTTLPYDSCAVVQPADEQVLFEAEGVTLSVQLSPGKRPGDQVAVSFDGKPLAGDSPDQLDFRVAPIDRGSHTVSATVRDAGGRSICQSATVTFYVRQTSALAPNSPVRRH